MGKMLDTLQTYLQTATPEELQEMHNALKCWLVPKSNEGIGMKTVGERFDEMAEAAGVSKTDKSYYFGRSCCFQIATEQKALDIEKALDAHCEYCDHTCPKGMECYIRENIRKAMEENRL